MENTTSEPESKNKPQVAAESLQQKDEELSLLSAGKDVPKLLADTSSTALPEKLIVPVEENAEAIPSPAAHEEIRIQSHNPILSIVGMQIILLVIMLGISVGYGWFHNVPSALTVMSGNTGVEVYSEAIANFNFVGVSPENLVPSFFSVMIEAGIWSFAGVLARSEYYLTQVVLRRKDVKLLETISKLIGDGSMGVAIAMAVVAFFWSTELVNLTLKTADIGAIAAIAFILGFYHEDTRRLLGNFRDTLSGPNPKSDEDEKAD